MNPKMSDTRSPGLAHQKQSSCDLHAAMKHVLNILQYCVITPAILVEKPLHTASNSLFPVVFRPAPSAREKSTAELFCTGSQQQNQS
jgi:hypothetical protein